MQFGILERTGEVGILVEKEGEEKAAKGIALPFAHPPPTRPLVSKRPHFDLLRSSSAPASASVGRGVGMAKDMSSMFLLTRQTSNSSTNSHTSSVSANGISQRWNRAGGYYGRGYGIDSIGQGNNTNIAPTRLSASEEEWISGHVTSPTRQRLNIIQNPDDEPFSDDDNDEQPFLDEEPNLIDMRIL